jgi:hypothetical protein
MTPEEIQEKMDRLSKVITKDAKFVNWPGHPVFIVPEGDEMVRIYLAGDSITMSTWEGCTISPELKHAAKLLAYRAKERG